MPDAPEDAGVGAEDEPVIDQVTEDAPEEDVDFTEAVASEEYMGGADDAPPPINPEEIEKEEE